MSTKIL
jgi:hypothetical protein